MSHIDTEIQQLNERLAVLEKKKQDEIRQNEEKRKFPLQTLEKIIEDKKQKILQNRYSKNIPLARFYDVEKIEMLEPIHALLQSLNERVAALENK